MESQTRLDTTEQHEQQQSQLDSSQQYTEPQPGPSGLRRTPHFYFDSSDECSITSAPDTDTELLSNSSLLPRLGLSVFSNIILNRLLHEDVKCLLISLTHGLHLLLILLANSTCHLLLPIKTTNE